MPVAAVWLVSQGPHSFFFPRFLLPTVGAWAVLAGIGLARVDARAAWLSSSPSSCSARAISR